MTLHRSDHVIVGAGIAGLWLASRLLEAGRTVTMVEIGPETPDAAPPARPPLRFPERANVGAVQARHHALTGNASYWGGALIRNDAPSLAGMFDLADGDLRLLETSRSYDVVERRLGAPPLSRTPIGDASGPARLAEVNVIPGRKRNVARDVLRSCLGRPGFTLHCVAETMEVALGPDGRIETVTARTRDGATVVLGASHFVLAAGVVDSNLWALSHLRGALGAAADRIGTRLHDHWSLPIARLRWRRGTALDRLYPPTFRGGFIQGGRVEFEAALPWGVHAGFVHLQAAYDVMEPYATIKKWMNARQEGRSWREQAAFVLPLLRHAPRMLRIAQSRVVDRRLFVPEGTEVTVVLDFESFAHPRNRLTVERGEPSLYWDLRDEDVEAFDALRARGLALLLPWARQSGVDVTVLADDGREARRAHLATHAVDAFHLGGGLAVRRDSADGVLAPDLRFHRIRNLAVLGTAAFARPGIANPVETLLAMCENYVRSVAAS